jgi:protein-S-isoprenylcysteine O-methyltransferase Ste14
MANINVLIICWIIFLLYWLVSSFFVKRSATKINWRQMIFWRIAVILAIIIFSRLSNSETTSFFNFLIKSSFSFKIAGSVLTIFGLICAIWARIYLGRNWSGYVTYKENHELVTKGPYRFVRHPIYTSMILMFIGTVLYYGSLLVFILIVIVTTVFVFRARKEEKIMIKLFGQKYINYMKKTKRLIPLIW